MEEKEVIREHEVVFTVAAGEEFERRKKDQKNKSAFKSLQLTRTHAGMLSFTMARLCNRMCVIPS